MRRRQPSRPIGCRSSRRAARSRAIPKDHPSHARYATLTPPAARRRLYHGRRPPDGWAGCRPGTQSRQHEPDVGPRCATQGPDRGSAPDRTRGAAVGQWRAANLPAMRLCLSRCRRCPPLHPLLRRRLTRPDAAHDARRNAEDPADQRLSAQSRHDAGGHVASASVQQHQLPFSRRPRQSERHCRQRHALDGAGRGLRHRDRGAQGSHQGNLLVSSASSRQRRCADGKRHVRSHNHRRRLRRCPRDRWRPGTPAGADAGRPRLARHDRGLRDPVPGNRHALPDGQRATPTDYHHAIRRGAALAHPRAILRRLGRSHGWS